MESVGIIAFAGHPAFEMADEGRPVGCDIIIMHEGECAAGVPCVKQSTPANIELPGTIGAR
jgi:hypothetical protein